MKKYISAIIDRMNSDPGFKGKGVEKEMATHFVRDEKTKDYPIGIECFGITFEDSSYEIYREGQRRHVIEYVVSGKGVVEIEGKRFEVGPGDSYLLEAGTKQHYYANKKDPFKKYWVNITDGQIAALISLYGLMGIYYFPHCNLNELFQKLFKLEAISNFANDISYQASSIIFDMLMTMKESLEKENLLIPETMVKAKQIIDDSLTDKINIEEVAEQVFISKPTLIANFKKYYGDTPNHYRLQRKVDLACMMLRSSNLAISQIASDLGFPDNFAFSHWFRKMKETSPSEYRKKKR